MRLMTAANIWGLHCQLITVLALAAVIKHVDSAAQAGANSFLQNPSWVWGWTTSDYTNAL